MHPIFFLLVKQEIDELQEASIIYLVPYNEWVSPIVVVPRKMVKYEYAWTIGIGILSSKRTITLYHYYIRRVAGYDRYLVMEGFSGYNKFSIYRHIVF